MMLQLIFGRSGYGKTEYIHTVLVNAVDSGKPAYLIVPDQFTFAEEKNILESFGEAKAALIKVLSFSRLAELIFMNFGGISEKRIDDNGKLIIMSEAISALRDELEFFGKADISELMCDAVSDLKTAGISPHQVHLASLSAPKGLSDKLHDIAVIYEGFEALLSGRFIEGSDILTRLASVLEKNDFFGGSVVCLDSFESFSKQKLNILKSVMLQAEEVYASFCTDNSTDDSLSFFSPSNKAAVALRALAKENGVAVLNPILLAEPQRNEKPDIIHMEKNLFSDSPSVYWEKPENIHIFEAENIYAEAESVAAEIRRLVMEEGRRYSDFSVVCRDPDKYANVFGSAFGRYEIPCYISKAKSADSDPLIRLIIAAFEVVSGSYRTESILKLLKTGLGPLNTEEVSELENYVYIWRINGKAWKEDFYKNPDGYGSTNAEGEALLKLGRLNKYRNKVILPLQSFAEQINGTDVEHISTAVYQLLISYGTDKTIIKKSALLKDSGYIELADDEKRTWKYLMNILDQFSSSAGDTAMTPSEFCSLAAKIFAKQEIKDIPERQDTVVFGAPDKVLQSPKKISFICGNIQGEFPRTPDDKGVFTDREKSILSTLNIALEDTTEDKVLLEKYLCYRAATAPSEVVYLSYYCSDGKEDFVPGELIFAVRRLFPELQTRYTDESETMISTWASGFNALAGEYRKNSVLASSLEELMETKDTYSGRLSSLLRVLSDDNFKISDSSVAKALFSERYISASQIDVYHHCRFQYFCKYGLNIKERKPAEINVLEYGTLMHYLFENILRADPTRYKSSKALEKDITKLIKVYADENMGGFDNMSERDKYRFKRMCDTAVILIEHMVEELSNSRFKPEYFELQLNSDGDYQPLKITTPSGLEISVGGIIDRVDIYDSPNGKYVRVVDYKTGRKEFKLSDVLYGLNLQMLIYLAAITESGKLLPAGVLYMPSAMPGVSASKEMDEKQIKAEEDKKLRMNGAVLSDEEIIKAMEAEAEGRFIPVGIKKDGKLIRPDNAYTDKELRDIFGYAKRLVSTMADSLVNGDVSADPMMINANSCAWCPYASVCGKARDDKGEIKEKLSKKEVLELMMTKEGSTNGLS